MTTEIENTKSTTVHFKKSLPGVKGGLLLIETGICQPFYYLKLCCVERARLTNQVEYYEDKFKPPVKYFYYSFLIVFVVFSRKKNDYY